MQTTSRSAVGTSRPVRRRLRSLAAGELVNIPLHAAVWIGIIGAPVTLANVAGYLLFSLLLIEGAGYWLAKLHQANTRQRVLPGFRIFRLLRLANLPLLAIGVGFAAYGAVDSPGLGSWPGLGYGLFAIIEHVNYFHLQLSYDRLTDLRRLRAFGLRRSHLSRDLDQPTKR
ncbi:hypothetical protein AB0J90_14670 [Micromonospora sp. NPDC049523]|uniref:hypothetical protein n=1 Tax=Micromonospora sp. NPDC049523 TaxID=3155921 RepID=UPI0034213D4C